MIRLICYDMYNPLRCVYARFRQIGTSGWHARVVVRASATVCSRLCILVLLELCCVGSLKMEMVLRVGMFQLLP